MLSEPKTFFFNVIIETFLLMNVVCVRILLPCVIVLCLVIEVIRVILLFMMIFFEFIHEF